MVSNLCAMSILSVASIRIGCHLAGVIVFSCIIVCVIVSLVCSLYTRHEVIEVDAEIVYAFPGVDTEGCPLVCIEFLDEILVNSNKSQVKCNDLPLEEIDRIAEVPVYGMQGYPSDSNE